MAFIPPGPPDRIYTVENLVPDVKPQHQQLVYSDPEDGFPQRLTIYTGEIWVGHGSEEEIVTLTFQYPILGFFNIPPPSGGTAIGIVPINYPPSNQFRSAVANVSLSQVEMKYTSTFSVSDNGFGGVQKVAADLFQIELDPRQIINAVVLSGSVIAEESEVTYVSYRVSVLERLTENPPPQPPILIGPGGWTGKYNLDASGALGPLVATGIPQT
jgi:hypothetical protein